MHSFKVSEEDTKNGPVSIIGARNFPVCYIGRGTYAREIHCMDNLSGDDGVHLFYIGRYAALAGDIMVVSDSDHDYRSLYMGAIPEYRIGGDNNLRARVGQATGHLIRKGMTVIGDDVWIGKDAMLLSSVVIGTGAVIAARSVVTKDVPPYTIWAGNPAKQVGVRFSEDIIDKLLKISWWEFDKSKLAEIQGDMQGEVTDFVDKYYEEALRKYEQIVGSKQYEPGINCNLMAFVDVSTEHPTFCDIVENFYSKYRCTDTKLFLYYHKDNQNESDAAESVREIIQELVADSNIELCAIASSDDEKVIAKADYFILGRDIDNIERIGYAQKYGVKIISGVDDPMFRKI